MFFYLLAYHPSKPRKLWLFVVDDHSKMAGYELKRRDERAHEFALSEIEVYIFNTPFDHFKARADFDELVLWSFVESPQGLRYGSDARH